MNLISPQTAPSDLLSHKKQEKSAYYDDSISLPIVHENQYTAYYPEMNELQTEQQEQMIQESFSPVIRNKAVSTSRQTAIHSSRQEITEKNFLSSIPATTSMPFF
ncbi:unnamed protein product, partial [Rotaria magnacalcarata]